MDKMELKHVNIKNVRLGNIRLNKNTIAKRLAKVRLDRLNFGKMPFTEYREWLVLFLVDLNRQINLKLKHKIDRKLATIGFLTVVAGILTAYLPVTVMLNPVNRFVSIPYFAVCFVGYILAFLGYMMLHKAFERDLL